MNKSIRLLVPLSVLLLVGCNFGKQDETKPIITTPTTSTTDTTTTPPTTTTPATNVKTAKFFENSDVTFSDIQKIDILTQAQKDTLLKEYNKNIDPQYAGTWSTLVAGLSFYDSGEINNGIYKGQRLIIYNDFCDGMCFEANLYRFAFDKTTNTFTLLKKYSTDTDSKYVDALATKVDTTTTIKGLDLPTTIKLPGTDKVATLDQKDVETMDDFTNQDNGQTNTTFEDPDVGTVYYYTVDKDLNDANPMYGKAGFGCFFMIAADGTVSKYKYNPGLTDDKSIIINWTNGDKATSVDGEYAFTDTACGMGGVCYLISEANPQNLILVGKTSNGIDLFEPQNPQLDKSLNTYFETYKNTKDEKATMDSFMKLHPLLYWKDPIGRWSSFISQNAKPPAECGKPVIYLYPQKTTDVNVKVGIEKLTETIPAYSHNGWTVSANPNGKLYNYEDGKNYPYLYWEGQGKGTTTPDKGFVVARKDVGSFLDNSLSKMGLNATETFDFKDFWVSRILANNQPYFFFNFIGTSDFNKVAPLTITPAPDTLLRIFMYYKPLDSKINVQPETLKAVARRGFTVVEWGGTSSIPWKK